MSVKRIYYVKKAQQRFAKTRSDQTIAILRKDGTPKMGRGGRPMTRRVSTADKTRPLPNRTCSKCHVEIKPGDPYLYWEPYFRSNTITVRCMKAECFPRPSERESSLMAEVLSAQESAEAQLNDLSSAEDASFFESIRDEVAEAVESVKDQYTEAAEAFNGQGPNQEKADELESAYDELTGVDFDSPPERDELDGCEAAGTEEDAEKGIEAHADENVEGCEACDVIYEEAMDEWRDAQADTLREAMGQF